MEDGCTLGIEDGWTDGWALVIEDKLGVEDIHGIEDGWALGMDDISTWYGGWLGYTAAGG